MLLIYEDYAFQSNMLDIVLEWNKIENDESLNEGAFDKLLGKVGNIAGFAKKWIGKIEDVAANPQELLKTLGKEGVMSKKDFETFAKEYAKIYDDIEPDFLKRHKKSFDIINDRIKTVLQSQRLKIEIATGAEKLAQAREDEEQSKIDAAEAKRQKRRKRVQLEWNERKRKRRRKK
jgi:hypothetical protein